MRISSDGFQMFSSNMKHKSRQGASFKMMFWGLQVATFLFLVKGVESSGILEIHFLEYKNIHGRSYQGEKCPWVNRRESRCTDIFKVTLASKLFSETLTTKAFQEDSGIVTFGNVLNDVISNPWKIRLQKIEDRYDFEFKVTVENKFFGKLKNTLDTKDYFSGGKQLTIDNKKQKSYLKTLKLKIRAYCDDTMYLEPHCSKKKCTPRNDESGHYLCNEKGEKVCLAGWKNITSGCLKADPTTPIIHRSYSTRQPKLTSKFQETSFKSIEEEKANLATSKIKKSSLHFARSKAIVIVASTASKKSVSEPTPSIHCSQKTFSNSKRTGKVGSSSVDCPNAVKTSSKKVTQTVNETKEKLSYRIIINSSGRQETDFINPSLTTSVLYPSGKTGTNTSLRLSLIQISLLSLIALSFILVCVLLACMICQKRKFSRKLQHKNEAIEELRMRNIQDLTIKQKRERTKSENLPDKNNAYIINHENKELINQPGGEYEGFRNPLTGNKFQGKHFYSGIPDPFKITNIDDIKCSQESDHFYDHLSKPESGNTLGNFANQKLESPAFPPLPPRKMLKSKKHSKKKSPEIYEAPPPPPPLEGEYSVCISKHIQNPVYDSDFAKREMPTSLPVPIPRVQNKNNRARNSMTDDGYDSWHKDSMLNIEQKHIYRNSGSVPEPHYEQE